MLFCSHGLNDVQKYYKIDNMNFETIVVIAAVFLYAAVGTSYAIKGNYPWALVWYSYSSANVGLIIAALNNKL